MKKTRLFFGYNKEKNEIYMMKSKRAQNIVCEKTCSVPIGKKEALSMYYQSVFCGEKINLIGYRPDLSKWIDFANDFSEVYDNE